MSTKKTITCKLDPANAKRLDKLAKAIGMTRSELVAHCIALGLQKGENIAQCFAPPTSANLLRLDFNRDEDDPYTEQLVQDYWRTHLPDGPDIDEID